jgi:hypothetical protein
MFEICASGSSLEFSIYLIVQADAYIVVHSCWTVLHSFFFFCTYSVIYSHQHYDQRFGPVNHLLSYRFCYLILFIKIAVYKKTPNCPSLCLSVSLLSLYNIDRRKKKLHKGHYCQLSNICLLFFNSVD